MTQSRQTTRKPVVMTIAGHDPSGGAGQQADIEAIVSMGCHAASVITTVTVQDTHNVYGLQVLDVELIGRQAETVLADMPVDVIKLGVLGSAAVADAVADVLDRHPDIPVVLDPVLVAAGGGALAVDDVIHVFRERLMPRATVMTPNTVEARQVVDAGDDPDACGRAMLGLGCRYALITGGDGPGEEVENRLYGEGRVLQVERWPRLPGTYHGAGCTLASAIAALMARGRAPYDAVQEAQRYVWDALDQGYRLSDGQHLPNRLFWADEDQR